MATMIPAREIFGKLLLAIHQQPFKFWKAVLFWSFCWYSPKKEYNFVERTSILARHLYIFLFVTMSFMLSCCQREGGDGEAKPLFDDVPSEVVVQPSIAETSGIADSKLNPGFLWAQEDGGNPPELILLKHNGAVQKRVVIDGATNRDWEDLCLSVGYLYIGDIGDNNGIHTDYRFYKFQEPATSADTIYQPEIIRFRYPDGSHDAEAFFVHPSTGAIYIITKRDNPSRIYKLAPPFSSSVNVAEAVGQLTYGGVVSAGISVDGKEVIVKTYLELGYYKVNAGETIETALGRTPLLLPYRPEPQGEAVGFSTANTGYFTLSERGSASEVKLYFYKRK